MADEYRQTAKKLVALHIFSDLDYDMLARYFIARAAWQNAQNWANRAIMQGDAKEAGSWTKTANVYFGQCQSCAAALGLSVSARCRLVMPEPPKDEADEDPLSRMLRERAERPESVRFVRAVTGSAMPARARAFAAGEFCDISSPVRQSLGTEDRRTNAETDDLPATCPMINAQGSARVPWRRAGQVRECPHDRLRRKTLQATQKVNIPTL